MELAKGGEVLDYIVAHGSLSEKEVRLHARAHPTRVCICMQGHKWGAVVILLLACGTRLGFWVGRVRAGCGECTAGMRAKGPTRTRCCPSRALAGASRCSSSTTFPAHACCTSSHAASALATACVGSPFAFPFSPPLSLSGFHPPIPSPLPLGVMRWATWFGECGIGAAADVQVRKYCRQMVQAVDHLHSADIVHRDLKTENLLLDHNLNLKLVDFGLSNSIKDKTALTTMCGSPAYTAPELLGGKKYGKPVDIWSMCVANLFFPADKTLTP